MAKIFIVEIGNYLDDTSYSKVIVTPEGYTKKDVQSAKDCGYILKDLNEDNFILDIIEHIPDWLAFTEDDFGEIKDTLRDLNVL